MITDEQILHEVALFDDWLYGEALLLEIWCSWPEPTGYGSTGNDDDRERPAAECSYEAGWHDGTP